MASSRRFGNAIVIGGSIAGLLAARALADHFALVTLVERDTLPTDAEQRKGVPQGKHAHGLLSGGQRVLEDFFPGLTDELIAAGATRMDVIADARWYQPGGYRPQFASGLFGISLSRPLLEAGIRRRVLALPNVTAIDRHDVARLLASPERDRVTSVVLHRRDEDGAEQTLAAELVVDAGGRGSQAPAWLEALGYDRPEEEKIVVGIGYTTRLYRRQPGELRTGAFVVTQPTPPDETRTGVLLPIEGDLWIATLCGWLGDHAPADDAGFMAFARSLPTPDIYEVIAGAEPVGDYMIHKFPANLRRRYERMARLPEGYVVVGDAMCSFNPVYGQGMSAAALGVKALAESLEEARAGLAGLPGDYYARAAKVIDIPWQLAAGADLAYPEVVGERGPETEMINRYMGQVLLAATTDPLVCRVLVEVTNLLVPPSALFAPDLVAAVEAAAFRVQASVEPAATAAGASAD